MKRYPTIGMLMGAVLLAHVSTASAQRWGREAMPRSGACFYEDVHFSGRYFCSPVGSIMPSVPRGMNDRVSSVRVFGNAVVTLYRDPDLRGQARFVDYDVPDMRGLGFNDRVSSYAVDPGRGFDRARTLVRRSYQSVLGRSPDAEGLRNWTEQVMRNDWSERDLQFALRQSREYRERRDDDRPRGDRRR